MTEGTLKTLIIDDSPTDAQMLSYLLTKRLGCRVEVANDGLDGLDKLSAAGKFDIVFLDLLMPVMSGVEVLDEIRGSSETADLPVVVISGVTDPRTVRSLLQMKVLDYIIKPYHAEIIVKRLSEKLAALRSRVCLPVSLGLPDEETVREDGREIILVADGDANFRHFCATTIGARFHVLEAVNGAQAIAMALKYSPGFLFAGSKLGVFDRDRMVAKIRKIPTLANLKVYGVNADGQSSARDSSLYDGQIRRTFVPKSFLESVDRWLNNSGADQTSADAVGNIRDALISATEQVFGMMMSAEVFVEENPPPMDTALPTTYGTIKLASYKEHKQITITFHAPRACVVAMSMRMLQMEEEQTAQHLELAHSSVAEVLNIIASRVNNSLDEEGRTFILGLPRVEEKAAADTPIAPKDGFVTAFTAGESIHFSISLWTDRLATSNVAKSNLSEGMMLAKAVNVGGSVDVPKGAKLNGEMIAELQKVALDELEIFESF